MNRREFSTVLCGAAAPWLARSAYAQQQAGPSNPIRRDWLDRRKEPVLEPELPIIDPHHHLWQRPGWRYLLEDLLLDTGSGHNNRRNCVYGGPFDVPRSGLRGDAARRRDRVRQRHHGRCRLLGGKAAAWAFSST